MNIPLRQSDHLAHGSPEMLRACAAECLQMVAFYASHAVGYADAFDDPGLSYATRNAIAYLRQAADCVKLLREGRDAADDQEQVREAAP